MLVVSSLFSLFCVNVHALDNENLIDSNLSKWTDVNDLFPEYFNNINTSLSGIGDNWQHVTLTPDYKSAIIYDLSDLSIDTPYKFSFEFQIVNSYLSIFNVYDVHIGVATLDTIGVPTGNTDPHVEYVLTSANYTEFLQSGFSMQFNLSSFVGEPCVYFAFIPKDNANLSQSSAVLHVRNVSLVQLDENSKKLDGILGWLQELWNSITGGFDRIQIKIGEVITNLSGELQSVREGITIKLGEVITGLTGELRMLGDNIINSIRNFFIPSDNYFDNKINEMQLELETNLGAVYQVSNLLDDFLQVLMQMLQQM